MRKVLALAPLMLIITGCGGGGKDVRIDVALPPKLDLANYQSVYFPGFISERPNEKIDAEREALNFLRREFLRRSAMDIVKRNPVDLSEKDPRSFFVRDQPYFRSFNMPSETLALTGVIDFESVDRSGFREEEVNDYVTGRRRIQARYVEVTGFNLNMRVYVYELGSGKLLYSDVLMDTMDVEGSNPDERLVLYDLMQRVSDRVMGLFSNTLVKAERSLL